MASTMRATVCGTKVSAAQRASLRPAKVAVCASLRQEVAKIAQVAGVSVASLALALSANAETIVKMGADNGAWGNARLRSLKFDRESLMAAWQA